MARISRRELGLATLAAGSAKAAEVAEVAEAAQADTKYSGALDGFESKVDPTSFDPTAWTRERWKSAPLQLTYKPGPAAQTQAWQRQLRAKIAELVGGIPATRTTLKTQLLETRTFPTYRREKLVIMTRPGVSLLAYVLTPNGATEPLPTAICVPGHGRGVDDIVGVDAEGRDRTDKAGYQHDFALQAVEQGMAAVAIEPMGFGCRRDEKTRRRGLGNSSCQPNAGAALLFGETMIGWRAYDVMRTIDYIETRKDLDAKRIGCMGISGGGTVTLFTAALEPRIKAAFVSGYLNTFRDSILSIAHCIDNYVPGILNWAEMYDVAGLIAPRPLFVESGDRDNIFPVEASREAVARVIAVYRSMGVPERVGHEVFSGEHSFHGAAGLPFLKKSLMESYTGRNE
ncbi:MAG: acetylxylan esterase [Acidobacteria bacterium]|nr:acetylxylan esterase [Acidobacteriota bacterium]